MVQRPLLLVFWEILIWSGRGSVLGSKFSKHAKTKWESPTPEQLSATLIIVLDGVLREAPSAREKLAFTSMRPNDMLIYASHAELPAWVSKLFEEHALNDGALGVLHRLCDSLADLPADQCQGIDARCLAGMVFFLYLCVAGKDVNCRELTNHMRQQYDTHPKPEPLDMLNRPKLSFSSFFAFAPIECRGVALKLWMDALERPKFAELMWQETCPLAVNNSNKHTNFLYALRELTRDASASAAEAAVQSAARYLSRKKHKVTVRELHLWSPRVLRMLLGHTFVMPLDAVEVAQLAMSHSHTHGTFVRTLLDSSQSWWQSPVDDCESSIELDAYQLQTTQQSDLSLVVNTLRKVRSLVLAEGVGEIDALLRRSVERSCHATWTAVLAAQQATSKQLVSQEQVTEVQQAVLTVCVQCLSHDNPDEVASSAQIYQNEFVAAKSDDALSEVVLPVSQLVAHIHGTIMEEQSGTSKMLGPASALMQLLESRPKDVFAEVNRMLVEAVQQARPKVSRVRIEGATGPVVCAKGLLSRMRNRLGSPRNSKSSRATTADAPPSRQRSRTFSFI
ncbi:MAG: hypothetical protein MHM6MM_005822 [Cercozoa sp. M6MM]